MRFSFAIYQQNKFVCLNWNKKTFRNFLRSLLVLAFFMQCLYDGESWWLFAFVEIKPCTVTSDNQRKWKNCVSDRGKHWKIVFAVFRCFFMFTIFFFASVFFFFFMKREEAFTYIAFGAVARKGCRNLF